MVIDASVTSYTVTMLLETRTITYFPHKNLRYKELPLCASFCETLWRPNYVSETSDWYK